MPPKQKSENAQVPNVKWHRSVRTVGHPHLQFQQVFIQKNSRISEPTPFKPVFVKGSTILISWLKSSKLLNLATLQSLNLENGGPYC